MSGSSLFSVVVVGLLAGALAHGLVGRRRPMFAGLLTGLTGALLGTLAARLLGLPLTGLAALAGAALAGSVTLVVLLALIRER